MSSSTPADDNEHLNKDVTAGEGRVPACLCARSDKLSSKCEYVRVPPPSWNGP